MPPEKKVCQNCKNEFAIQPEDFAFYEKMKVPAPTWCPQCRLQRRMLFQSERALYSRQCDLCKKPMISVFPAEAPFPVYCPPCWFSDGWEATDYGRGYDFTTPFFSQFRELLNVVPRIGLNFEYTLNVNSPYVNLMGAVKNSHLIFNGSHVEDSLYCTNVYFSQGAVDCTTIQNVTNSYSLFNCDNCYNSVASVDCKDSYNLYFSKDCLDCSDCFGCVNLRHKKHYMFNEQLSQEQYEQKLKSYDLASHKGFQGAGKQARDFWKKFPNRFMHGTNNEDVSGDYISNSKNVQQSFDVNGAENVKFGHNLAVAGSRDCYDFSRWGENSELVYDCDDSGLKVHNVKFCYGVWDSSNLDYCITAGHSNDCVGCISLRKKKYCILNKQYTQAEYEALYPRVMSHLKEMSYADALGRSYAFGEYFPPELSSFAYNETIVQQYFPLTKEQALEQGYKWKGLDKKAHTPTVQASELPDHIREVKDDITKQVVLCEHAGACMQQCSYVFKVIPQELEFYRRFNLPLPRLCPNCRHSERLKHQNPIKLWQRKCSCAGPQTGNYRNAAEHFHGSNTCPNEFETSYSPERPEIVYCEQCYQAEVA